MANAGELTPFILGTLKGEDAGRVALYHFLKNFQAVETPVTPQLINDFFSEVLQLKHWQERKLALYTDVSDLLRRFFSSLNQPFRHDLVWDLNKIQLVQLEHVENLCSLVKILEDRNTAVGETVRVMPENDNRALSIKRNALGEIIVKVYSPLVRIQGAEILPMNPEQEIYYDAGMEIRPNTVNKVKLNANAQCRFALYPSQEGQLIYAQFVQGYAFRQSQSLKLHTLAEEPRLFFLVKRLERHYINKNSDPYYQELVSSLDKSLSLLQNKAPGALDYAAQAFESGQIAFDQIFHDDKALYARLRELARWISSPAARKEQTASP